MFLIYLFAISFVAGILLYTSVRGYAMAALVVVAAITVLSSAAEPLRAYDIEATRTTLGVFLGCAALLGFLVATGIARKASRFATLVVLACVAVLAAYVFAKAFMPI